MVGFVEHPSWLHLDRDVFRIWIWDRHIVSLSYRIWPGLSYIFPLPGCTNGLFLVFNRRLSSLMGQLKSRQPSCPQLYIYSSADKVIPAEYVESFITEQQRIGHQVRSCNFISTPHVDHLRNDPELYTSQLTQFLEDCMLCCKQDPNP